MPIPPATAAASSGRSQMEESHAVAETPTQHNSRTDESRMDDDGEERETNSEVRQHRTPDDELRQILHCKRAKVTRERWQ